MAKVLIPGNGTDPTIVRNFDEVVVFDRFGRYRYTLTDVDSIVLAGTGSKRQLGIHRKSVDGFDTRGAYKVMFYMLLGGWIIHAIQLLGQVL